MNIILYSLIYPPDVCSNAYVFADLTEELLRRGHHVTVITTTPHYGGSSEQLHNGKKRWYKTSTFHEAKVYHICVGSEKGGIAQRLDTYARFHHYAVKLLNVEGVKADVILSQTPPPILAGFTTTRLGKRLSAKTVFILQDIWVDNLFNRKKIGNTIYKLLCSIEHKVYKKPDAIVTLTEEMAEAVEKKLENKDILHIIPNPVNTEIYYPRKRTYFLRKKYKIEENDFVASYVGNLAAAQNLYPLIEYAKNTQNIKVIIAGNGNKEKEYRAAAAGCDRIIFLGYISREETTEVNTVSDVCMVMLSGYVSRNCLPSKLPTIMAMGKPIALCCSPGAGLAEYVEKNQIGLTSNIESQTSFIQMMDTFRMQKDLCEAFGNNSYNCAIRDFSLSTIVDRYEELFRNITYNP
ncbi:MAG: glycosyltransferase family 4 protein [Ruminococcus sp.]|nr:glycosyltransferase family 4 protein [Ruminococcus sp.]